MIAAASVAAALHGLGWTSKSGCTLNELLNDLHRIMSIEQVSNTLYYCLIPLLGTPILETSLVARPTTVDLFLCELGNKYFYVERE